MLKLLIRATARGWKSYYNPMVTIDVIIYPCSSHKSTESGFIRLYCRDSNSAAFCILYDGRGCHEFIVLLLFQRFLVLLCKNCFSVNRSNPFATVSYYMKCLANDALCTGTGAGGVMGFVKTVAWLTRYLFKLCHHKISENLYYKHIWPAVVAVQ